MKLEYEKPCKCLCGQPPTVNVYTPERAGVDMGLIRCTCGRYVGAGTLEETVRMWNCVMSGLSDESTEDYTTETDDDLPSADDVRGILTKEWKAKP